MGLLSLALMGLSGAIGGASSALATDNRFWWPSRVSGAGNRNITRPGIVICMAVGMAAAGLVGVLCPSCVQPPALSALVAAALVGCLAGRCLTSEADKRLLRSALCRACVTPAAHPDTVKLMSLATPFAAYQASRDLAPAVRWIGPAQRIGPVKGAETRSGDQSGRVRADAGNDGPKRSVE